LINKTLAILPAAVAALAVAAPPAQAWGPRGHRVAAKVAEGRLTPAARAAVRDLLHEGDTLAGVADWADHEGYEVAPGSAGWHYVNVPIDTPHYTERFCPAGTCVVAKIEHFRKAVVDPRATKAQRSRSLLFLVHLIQDVHQPLHVGDRHDRGGNLTQVQYQGEGTNLHHLWDSQILDAGGRDDRAAVLAVEKLLTPANVAAWSRGGADAWADESLQDAKRAYRDPPDAPRPFESGATLSRGYTEFALPVVHRRLAQAAVRLANELNALFP